MRGCRRLLGGVEAIEKYEQPPIINNSYVGEGRIIPADATLTPIRVAHNELAKKLENALVDTEFSICVCSFYGDCQRLIGKNPQTEPVATCVGYREAEPVAEPFVRK